VAVVDEAVILRDAGIDAPILLLSEPSFEAAEVAVAIGLDCAVYTERGIEAIAKASAQKAGNPVAVHLKVDTGMYRVGAQLKDVGELARSIARRPELELAGLWTHCAVADEPGNPFTDIQRERFEEAQATVRAEGIEIPLLHAANSAAAIDRSDLRYDMVRCGIASYGLDPSPAMHGRLPLRPAFSLIAEVSHVKTVTAGESLSYGQRHRCDIDTVIATVPLGYADGVARRLSAVGGEVLIGGRRRPIVGTITMDQFLVDCGPADESSTFQGDEVVLIGTQGNEQITADDWATWLDTISYEVVCGISSRVPRRHQAR
ncbi:MAG: alanine racemase, partial [Acidimicrobiales bacterium]